MRRLAPTLMFLACSGGLVYTGMTFRPPPARVQKVAAAAPAPVRELVTVRGQVSADKIAVMSDPEMTAFLAANGLAVQVGSVPGRDMISPPAPETQYVFSWPTDDETASVLAGRLPRNPWVRTTPSSFYTSPVILAWAPAADALARAGMVQGTGRWRSVDMKSLVSAVTGARRWNEVSPKGPWTSERPLQVRMPDLLRSGTTTMFLAVAAQSANEGREVVTTEQAVSIADRLTSMFQQGRQPATAGEAISEFVAFGISRTPLLLVSEADAIQLLNRPDASRDIVVLYPDQTVVAPQVFIPYTLMGQRVGRLLDRPAARRIALRHGFRVVGATQVPGRWASGVQGPPAAYRTILEMPDPAIVETMIGRITERRDAPVRRAETEKEPEAEPQEVRTAPQPTVAAIRDPGEEAPPVRPVIDPDGDSASQQAQVQDYIRRLEEYRARQAARAAAAGANQP